MKAYLDRIVDNKHAIILVGDDEKEFIVPKEQLPESCTTGMWLQVKVDAGSITEIHIDHDETDQTAKRIQDKLAQLRKNSSSQFLKKS
jgi:hypothetical protein